MAYLIFITRDNLFYSKLAKTMEIFTEMMALLAFLILMQFMRDLPPNSKAKVSGSFITALSLLIIGNISYTITVMRINSNKAKREKALEEEKEKQVKKAAEDFKVRQERAIASEQRAIIGVQARYEEEERKRNELYDPLGVYTVPNAPRQQVADSIELEHSSVFLAPRNSWNGQNIEEEKKSVASNSDSDD